MTNLKEVNRKGRRGFLFLTLLLLCALCGSLGFAQEKPGPALTEVEQLKGENLQLKLDSADKQMRLLQEQYARLAELQAALLRQLQELERALLTARGLSPADWSVNWQAKQIEQQPQRRGDTEKKEEKEIR